MEICISLRWVSTHFKYVPVGFNQLGEPASVRACLMSASFGSTMSFMQDANETEALKIYVINFRFSWRYDLVE
jgi:hypothetical protein